MRTMNRFGAAVVLFAFLGVADAQEQAKPEQKKETASERTERDDMRKEVEEAARAIEAYSLARRDEAQQRAKDAIDAMDRRIQQLQVDWHHSAERMNAAARANRDRTMADLRSERAALADRYRKMQESSGETWNRIRDDFVSAYRRIAEAVRTAGAEYDAQKSAEEGPVEGDPAKESEPSH